ncbi:hypothetical protein CVT24_010190 [Panaeolus cyanescens]|uniref:G domain-containing protein n=1 Tax=Panaeolus cyanescens TaxID=181874 RepID=A0A409YPX8_9AGAR|nr:hypothetical protein CVT24_010190 [Panaeolus cyanescens]
MRSLTSYLLLFTLYFTSLFYTAHANPPDLVSVLKPGAKVYRAVTGGELPYADRYVVGNPPPPYLPIAGDFAKYGAFYTFATLKEAFEWGMHMSGFYYKKPSDHIKNPDHIHKFYIIELEYNPGVLNPTTKFFAKGGSDYTAFIKENYPPAGHPGSLTMEWGGTPQPAAADIIEGPMSNSRKEPHIRNPDKPPGEYNHQIAFTSQIALSCLKVVTKIYNFYAQSPAKTSEATLFCESCLDGPTLALRGSYFSTQKTGDVSVEIWRGKIPDQSYRILLLGATGSGKSSFIEALAGSGQKLGISGSTLDSVTQVVQAFRIENMQFKFQYGDMWPVFLIDTPGFSDSKMSEAEVVNKIQGRMDENGFHPTKLVKTLETTAFPRFYSVF